MGDTRDVDVMTAAQEAIELLHRGERAAARERFTALWAELGDDGDPLARCTVAHYMADAQDEAAEELAWDLRALAAAATLTDERAQSFHPTLSVAGFLPSLQLNVAASYAKLGHKEEARRHLAEARIAAESLPGTELGRMTAAAIERLRAELHGS